MCSSPSITMAPISVRIASIPMMMGSPISSSRTTYATVDIICSLVGSGRRVSHEIGMTRAVVGSMNDVSGQNTGYITYFNTSATDWRMSVIAKFVAKYVRT